MKRSALDLTGPVSELERYECLTATAGLLVRHAYLGSRHPRAGESWLPHRESSAGPGDF